MNRELDPIAEQAIAWLVRLRSGRDQARQQAALQVWLDENPAHIRAWEQLQRGLGNHYELLRKAPSSLREPLVQPELKRRDVLRGLAGLGLLGGGLWLGVHSQPGQTLLADLSTGSERRELSLPDGSRLNLNAGSAVDVDFTAERRLLTLRQGSLVVQVAADRNRPLIVRTAQGEARALGTRFLVEQQAASTHVMVLEHAVQVSLPSGARLDLQEGQAALLQGNRIERLAGEQRYRADWLDGHLSVLDEPLATVIDALRPYHRGLLGVSPQVRDLRVQGVFPLDDTRRSLTALAETLPIRVDRYGPWLTLVGPAN
ncbi:FecR family protein [Pseudomonas subflava]|uniref:FecR family protein n=1 Tax=Pseudomonas subflava TaxID=2952933 RepID=UPI00207A455C|nr:FecR family protein [Pseudomonas subflava]